MQLIIKLGITITFILNFCVIFSNCLVKERCFTDKECGEGKICIKGECILGCRNDEGCEDGMVCKDGKCIPKEDGSVNDIEDIEEEHPLIPCPEDMVPVGKFCIDKYEASRPDATETSPGSNNSYATSRALVLPWTNVSWEEAKQACEASGKRLCTPEEWEKACKGPHNTTYCYGDEYDPKVCNGIDTFGRENFHLLPTGSLPNCTNEYGVYDMNGNVWEFDSSGNGRVRGGAYNCIDSKSLHQCSYYIIFGTGPKNNVGFRCCKDR